MKVNCLILDDDLIDQQTIKDFVEQIPSLHLIDTCSSIEEAHAFVASGQVQLLFSDVELTRHNGLDFVKSWSHPPLTIFITSFPHYAVEGFNTDAIDFLVKPVAFERFLKAVNKAIARLPAPTVSEHVFVKIDGQFTKLHYEEILFIEAYGDFVKISTPDAVHVVLISIKNIEKMLPAERFLKIHRSYLVNRSKISSVSQDKVKVGNVTIPLGPTFRDAVYLAVVDKNLLKRFPDSQSSEKRED